MKWLLLLLVTCWAVAGGPSSAFAEKRVALVVGNSGYANTGKLANPENDARDVAAALKDLGFEVQLAMNLDKRGMDQALAGFARANREADAALFFYAGHGMQFHGANYLMPVDARLEDDVSVRWEMLRVDDVVGAMDKTPVRLLLLDACRNNPLAERMTQRTNGVTRAVDAVRGLAPTERTRGMVVAYATQANDLAIDGDSRNSPFTAALLTQLKVPGVEVGQMFRRVAQDVHRTTQGKQLPELSISLLADFYLNKGLSDVQAWARIRDTSDPRVLRDFISAYPSSFLVSDATELLKRLDRMASTRSELETANGRARELQTEMERTRAELKAAEAAVDRRVAAERAELLRREEASRLAERDAAALKGEVERLRREAEEARTALQTARATPPAALTAARAELEAANGRTRDLQDEVERARAELKAAEAAVDRRVEAERAELLRREQASKKAERDAEALKADVERLRREAESANAALQTARAAPPAALTAARAELEAANGRARDLQNEVERARAELKAAEAVVDRRVEVERAELLRREQASKKAERDAEALKSEVERLRREAEEARIALQTARSPVVAAASPAAVSISTPIVAVAPVVSPPIDGEMVRKIKEGLKRVGCWDGAIDGDPSGKANRAGLERFARHAALDPARIDFGPELRDRIDQTTGRVCPLVCAAGKIEKKGTCVAQACGPGETRDTQGDCVAKPRPKARTATAPPAAARNGGGRKCVTIGARTFCE